MEVNFKLNERKKGFLFLIVSNFGYIGLSMFLKKKKLLKIARKVE